MDRNDLIQMSFIVAMVVWSIIHKMFLTSYIDDVTAQQIGLVILIAPMFILEIAIQHITGKYPYIRAIVRPSNKVLRFYIKEKQRIPGEGSYDTMRIKTGWPVKPQHHDKTDLLRIVYKGVWSDLITFRPGRSRYFDYEVNHPQTEQIILYEMMRECVDVDHFLEVPTYFLRDATGHYNDFMKLPLERKEPPKTEKPPEPPLEEPAQEVPVEVAKTE